MRHKILSTSKVNTDRNHLQVSFLFIATIYILIMIHLIRSINSISLVSLSCQIWGHRSNGHYGFPGGSELPDNLIGLS